MTGDRWGDGHRFTDNRGIDVETTVNRARRTADMAAVIRTLTPGEIDYARTVFELWSEIRQHKGIRGAGKAMLVLLEAELARRELDRAATLAQFDAIAAELRPDPLPTGPTDGLPRWSEISADE